MSDFNNEEFYKRIDQLIRLRATGKPKEFAAKLEVSESHLYRILLKMKEDAGCPIKFCRNNNTYYYEKERSLIVKFGFEQI